jgi:hypothetical protein
MEITVTSGYRDRGVGAATVVFNSQSIAQAGGTSSSTSTTASKTPALVIPFFDTANPIITDYQTNYAALYGDFPKIRLITYDELERRIYRSDQAIINETAEGLIDTIEFDLGGINDSGLIIIYPTT